MKQARPHIQAMFGSSSGAAGVHNRRVVIDAIRVNGALSRAELARATKLAKQTLSNIIEDLENEGLVTPQEAVREGRGKPAIPYALAPSGAFSVGLQIDRHLARCVVVNLLGEVVVRQDSVTSTGDPEAGLKELTQLIAQVRKQLAQLHPDSTERIVGLGVAMPGPFGPRHEHSDDDYTMAFWQSFALVDRLEAATGLSVNLQNDAVAATMAEKLTGKAHGKHNVVCLYFGYGLGAGLVINGELYDGHSGNAGEIGMIRMAPGGSAPDILERTLSLGGFCTRFGIDHSNPDLFSLITERLQSGDTGIDDWLKQAAEQLAWVSSIMHLTMDPQAIILCGTAPESLIRTLSDRTNGFLEDYCESRILTGLSDPWIVALGAAAEPISRSFDPTYAALLKV